MILVESVYPPFANSGRNRKPRFSKENSFSLIYLGCMFTNVFDYKEAIYPPRYSKMCIFKKKLCHIRYSGFEIVDVSPRSDLINFLDITFLSVQPDLSRKCFLFICNQRIFQPKIYHCSLSSQNISL